MPESDDDSSDRVEPAKAFPTGRGMIFTLTFAMWTGVLIAAWFAARQSAMAAFAVALILSVALFVHHMTDPLTLSF